MTDLKGLGGYNLSAAAYIYISILQTLISFCKCLAQCLD